MWNCDICKIEFSNFEELKDHFKKEHKELLEKFWKKVRIIERKYLAKKEEIRRDLDQLFEKLEEDKIEEITKLRKRMKLPDGI